MEDGNSTELEFLSFKNLPECVLNSDSISYKIIDSVFAIYSIWFNLKTLKVAMKEESRMRIKFSLLVNHVCLYVLTLIAL